MGRNFKQPATKPRCKQSLELIARNFKQNHKFLMDMIKKNGIFGAVCACHHSIEFQKCVLSSAYILVWLVPIAKLRPDEIDLAITDEITDPKEDPHLH